MTEKQADSAMQPCMVKHCCSTVLATQSMLCAQAAELGYSGVARCAFERGLERSPKHVPLLDRLADLLLCMGDHHAAHAILCALLRCSPGHPAGLAKARFLGPGLGVPPQQPSRLWRPEDSCMQLRAGALSQQQEQPQPERRCLVMHALTWEALLDCMVQALRQAIQPACPAQGSSLWAPITIEWPLAGPFQAAAEQLPDLQAEADGGGGRPSPSPEPASSAEDSRARQKPSRARAVRQASQQQHASAASHGSSVSSAEEQNETAAAPVGAAPSSSNSQRPSLQPAASKGQGQPAAEDGVAAQPGLDAEASAAEDGTTEAGRPHRIPQRASLRLVARRHVHSTLIPCPQFRSCTCK